MMVYKEGGNMKYCLLIVLLILSGCASNTVTISQDEYNSLLNKKAYYEEYIATTNSEMENLVSKEEVANQKVTIVNEIEELKAKIVELKAENECFVYIEGDFPNSDELFKVNESIDQSIVGTYISYDLNKIIVLYPNGMALKGMYRDSTINLVTNKYTTENNMLTFSLVYIAGTGGDQSSYSIDKTNKTLSLDYYYEATDAHTYETYHKLESE